MSLEESKRGYLEAYKWGMRVQQECLFKPVHLTLVCEYCEANFTDGNIDAWSITVDIWDAQNSKHIRAEWTAWRPQDFQQGKEKIKEYLASKGINI